MPGIITHTKIFLEALKHLTKNKDHSPHYRSLEILFAGPAFLRASLFGALGPDIFNYAPFRGAVDLHGSGLCAFLHSEGIEKSVSTMLDRVFLVDDHNNEWAATRRAYLYGYVSHLVTDAVFHPFVFYWVGFPGKESRRSTRYFREQYLLFLHNMDVYFQVYHDHGGFNLEPEKVIPRINNGRGPMVLEPPIRTLLADTILEVFPEMQRRPLWRWELNRGTRLLDRFGLLDMMPYMIIRLYTLHRSGSRRTKDFLDRLRRKGILPPDFVTRYPDPKRINRHVLNLHRERWYYPAGSAGLHYESADDLFRIAKDRVLHVWELLEASLYKNPVNLAPALRELKLDAFTGEAGRHRGSMHACHPFRPRF